jgi:hypothetical protein
MHISLTHRFLATTFSLFILVGCTVAPKPVSHEAAAKLQRWEYRYLDGVGSDHSPAAEKLKQAGWVFIGYNLSCGDTIAIDENSEVARRMSYEGAPRAVMQATFKREYQ